MGWKRVNGRLYYYSQFYINGRVISQYVGRGTLAEIAALGDVAYREERERERETERIERARRTVEDREIRAWFERIEAVADAAMIAAGYHKHRGQWRRRRDA